MNSARKRYVLLDRDGTIIVNKHYQKDPAVTELLPGAAEGLRLLRDHGFGLVLVSNQSGIGRGLLGHADVAAVHRRMLELLGGGEEMFAGLYYCPHRPEDGCTCRKPGTGMAAAASRELGFRLEDCIVVGDSEADIRLGDALGAGTVLVRTGNGRKTEGGVTADYVAEDLVDAAAWIVAGFAQ